MIREPFKPLAPGQPPPRLSASEYNREHEAIARLENFQIAGFGGSEGAGASMALPPGEDWILIRILSGSNPYTWEEVVRIGTAGNSNDYAQGERAGTTTTCPAFEGTSNTAVEAETIVWARINAAQSCLEFDSPADDVDWGEIGGTLANQTDLQAALDAKLSSAIISLNGQTNAAQTFADVDDTNITLSIVSLAGVHTFTVGWTGQLAVTRGGTGLSACAQGDLLYGSAANTIARLAKNASATRYLSNTGSSNDPAWAQINLTNGVSGVLPTANGGTGASDGSHVLPEIAAPATPASGFGLVYVSTSGALRFINDAGTDFDLTAAAGVSGSGTDDFLTEWTGATTLGNSGVWFDASAIAYFHWLLHNSSAPGIGTKRARVGPANLQNGDELGHVYFSGYAGGGYGRCVTVTAYYTGDGSNINGELAFISHVNGAGTEHARVTANGFKITQATASKIAKLNANKEIIGQDLTTAELPTLWTDTATKTAAYTAANKERVLVDSNAAAADFDVQLKASPSAGDRHEVVMVADHATRKVGIDRNGSNVNGSTNVDRWKLCLEGDRLAFHFVGGDTGWAVTNGLRLHSAKMSRNTAQSINDATNTKIALNNEIYDIGGIADPTTNNQFNARRAGKWVVGTSLRMSGGTWNTGERLLALIYHATAQVYAAEVAPYDDNFQVPIAITTLDVAAADPVEMYIHQGSGAAVNTETGSLAEQPQMWAYELP